MRGLVALTKTETTLFFREPAAVFFTLAFPIMLLLIFGTIFGNEPSAELNGWGSMDASVQGYIAMIIGTVALIGIPVTIASYREFGVLKRLKATPLRPFTVILAHVLVNALFTAIGIALLILIGKIVYDLRMPEAPFAVAVAAAIGYLAFSTFGFVLAGLFPTARTAQAVGSVIYFPQLFLSGAALPHEMFSDTLRAWTEPLPMTQVVELISDLWRGEGWNVTALAITTVIGLVSAVVAARIFRWE